MGREAGVDRFLGWRQVRDLTGLGRTTAWRMRCAGDFPQPVPISPGRVAWRERDIAAWNESRGSLIPAQPRSPAKPQQRPQKARVLPGVESAAQAESSPPPPRPPAPESGEARTGALRRARSAVAEGQLGFDF
ncbi:MAG: AlpA family phage regulatory protein [Brevundimonas sp.]|nr:AlpA family phage regulatory protein [Brevundimonas sp.]